MCFIQFNYFLLQNFWFFGLDNTSSRNSLLCDFEFEEHELMQFNYFVNQSGECEILTTLATTKGKPFVIMLYLIIY